MLYWRHMANGHLYHALSVGLPIQRVGEFGMIADIGDELEELHQNIASNTRMRRSHIDGRKTVNWRKKDSLC